MRWAVETEDWPFGGNGNAGLPQETLPARNVRRLTSGQGPCGANLEAWPQVLRHDGPFDDDQGSPERDGVRETPKAKPHMKAHLETQ